MIHPTPSYSWRDNSSLKPPGGKTDVKRDQAVIYFFFSLYFYLGQGRATITLTHREFFLWTLIIDSEGTGLPAAMGRPINAGKKQDGLRSKEKPVIIIRIAEDQMSRRFLQTFIDSWI